MKKKENPRLDKQDLTTSIYVIYEKQHQEDETTRSIRIAHKLIYNLRIPNTSLPLPIAGAVRAHVL